MMETPESRRMLIAPTCLLIAVIALVGCGQDTHPKPKDIDPVEALMTADRAFAAAVAAATPDKRAQVWAEWFAPAGRQIIPGQVVLGPDAILALMQPAFTSPGYDLAWEPDQVGAATDGDMGWTSGRYLSTHQTDAGVTTSEGRYVTIWRRQADGSYKVDLDTGIPDGP